MDDIANELGLNINRSIFEVRYSHSFLFEDLGAVNRIAKNLSNEFSQTKKTDDNKTLILIDPKKRNNAGIQSERTSFTNDDPKQQFSNSKSIAKKVINEATTTLDVDKFTRVGVRAFFSRNYDDLKDAISVVRKNLFANFADRFTEELTDPRIAFKLLDDEYNVNVQIRTEQSYSLSIENLISEYDSSNDLVIDIDVYKDTPIDPHDLNSTFKDAEEIMKDKIHILSQLVLGDSNVH